MTRPEHLDRLTIGDGRDPVATQPDVTEKANRDGGGSDELVNYADVKSSRVSPTEKPWADVTEYGAEGDGITDDASAIQSAIDAIGDNGGGRVYFPAGVYLVSSTITNRPNVTLFGDSRGASRLVANDPGYYLVDLSDASSFTVSSLTFDQDSVDNIDADGSAPLVFGNSATEDVLFEDCAFINSSRQGLNLLGSSFIDITSCLFRHCGRAGVVVPLNSEHLRVTDSTFDRTGDDAIAFNGVSVNCVAANNTIYRAGVLKNGGGIKVHGKRVVVANNVLEESNGYAIRLKETGNADDTPEDTIVTENVIYRLMTAPNNAPRSAIELQEIVDTHVIVSDNIVYPYETGQTNVRSVTLEGGSFNVTFSGNKFVQNTALPSELHFYVRGECDRLEIDDCQFYGGREIVNIALSTAGGSAVLRNTYAELSGDTNRIWVDSAGPNAALDRLMFLGVENNSTLNNFAVLNDTPHGEIIFDRNYMNGSGYTAGANSSTAVNIGYDMGQTS